MSKKLRIIPVILVICMSLFIVMTGCVDKREIEKPSFDFDGLGSAPPESILEGITPLDENEITLSEKESSDMEILDSASYIFRIANNNMQIVPYYASYAAGSGVADIKFGISVRGSMELKQILIADGKEWYYLDAGEIVNVESVSGSGKQTDINYMLSVVRPALDYATRYYTPDGKTFYYQSGSSNCFKNKPRSMTNFFDPYTFNWNKVTDKWTKKFNFEEYMDYSNMRYSNRDLTAMDIRGEFLESASVKDNGEYYTASMTVKIDSEAMDLNKKNLNASGNRELSYKYQTLTIEVWKSGLIRRYYTTNGWEGIVVTSLNIKGSSDNNYDQYFSYDKTLVNKLKMPPKDVLDDFFKACDEVAAK